MSITSPLAYSIFLEVGYEIHFVSLDFCSTCFLFGCSMRVKYIHVWYPKAKLIHQVYTYIFFHIFVRTMYKIL